MHTAAALGLRLQGEALPFSYRLPNTKDLTAIGLSTARRNKIFISYASEDVGFVRLLDGKLREREHDPWIDFDDVVDGTTREAQVQKGIQGADVFIFVVTPASVRSRLEELDLALKLNKLLIFVLWQPTESAGQLPDTLQQMSWLQIVWDKGANSLFDMNLLADFIINLYAFAKLLVRAHVWQQREYPQDLLLRAEDVTAVRASQQDLKHFLEKQAEFSSEQQTLIDASLAHADQESDVLLSYSHKDRAFVERLYDDLKEAGHSPWVDWKNIPVASDWQEEVDAGIQAVHTVLFIISPDSVISIHCEQEIRTAQRFNKRIITVLWRSDYDQKRLEALNLNKLHYVSFCEPEEFNQALLHLLKAIRTDLADVRQHQRLMRWASEWDEKHRQDGFLMTQQQLKEITLWRQRYEQSPDNELPALTPLQKKYILESDRTLKNNRTILASIGGLVAAILLSLSAFSITIAVEEVRALVNSLEDRRGLDALKVALKASKRLKQYGPLIGSFRPNLQIRAVTALHREIYSLRAANYLTAHEGKVFTVAFSPSGAVLASGGEDGVVRFWDSNGVPIAESQESHDKPVVSVDFSAEGELLASGSYDGQVKLWELDGKLIKTLPQDHGDRIIVISFSPGGQLLASASEDKTVQLWRRADRFQAPTVLGHEAAVVGLSFSPYGDKLVTADVDGRLYLWSADGTLLNQFDNGDYVLYLEFSPDGQTIVSADLDGTVKLRTLEGESIPLEENQHIDIAYRATFSPSGRFLASAGGGGTIKVWTKTGKLLHTLQGHLGAVYRLQFTSDERMLISAGADDTIKLWSVQQGLLLEEFEGHRDEILSMAMTSEGKNLLASASASGAVILWNLDNPIYTLPHTNRVYAVTFRPDGRIIASGGRQTIRLWNQQGAPISHIQATEPITGGVVNSLDYSPDSQLLASGDSDGEIKIWRPQDSTTGPLREFAEKHDSEIKAVRFSPDGNLLASASLDGTVKLWTAAGDLIDTLVHQAAVSDLAFVPQRGWLITATEAPTDGGQGDITVWSLAAIANDVRAEKIAAFSDRYPEDVGNVTSISVDPSGELLISGAMDASVKLWDLSRLLPESTNAAARLGRGGGILRTLEGHEEAVLDVGVSPNGKMLASASQDGTIKLWTRKGRLISTLDRHEREVSSLQFNPKTSMGLASASFDKQVLLWQLPQDFTRNTLGLLTEEGCKAVGSYLKVENGADSSGSQTGGDAGRSTVKEVIEFCDSVQRRSDTK